jgi:hypothetical protein
MLIDVLGELNRRRGWDVVYCVSYGTGEQVKKFFPNAAYQNTHDARYGKPAPELADMPRAPLDQPTAQALGYAQVMALKQMDRMEIMGGFPTHERIRHFHRLASYWSAVLDRLRPDVLLCITSPHVVYDYVAYSLARLRGIPSLMFEYVTTEGLLMAIEGFEDGLPPLMGEYRRLRAAPLEALPELSEPMENYWRRLKGNHERAIPAFTRKFQTEGDVRRAAILEEEARLESRAQEEATRGDRPLALIARAARKALGLQEPTPPAQPVPPQTDGHYDGRFHATVSEDLARAAASHRRRHTEAIRKRYEELAIEPDLAQPFIYVPLHLQPERSTNPNGGVFDDQDVMIGLIAASLPAGWRIYVKEHPSQFVHGFVCERGRWLAFYEAVLAHPNVQFIPLKFPVFELIDRCRAVASITGTSSWEALVRGTPTLVFGEAWYKGCEGAHAVRSAEDCRRALQRIAAGERPDETAVRLFLHAAEKTSFPGYLSTDDPMLPGVDERSNIVALADALASRYASTKGIAS